MMNKEKPKLLIIEALDHFRTENMDTKKCVLRYIGEYAGEDANYFILRYSDVHFDEKKNEEKLIKILRREIISKKEFF